MDKLQIYIDKRKNLFWYTPEEQKQHISDELLIETIFNYGTVADVKELFAAMGIKNVAAVFNNMKERKKQNLYPEIYHFFNLLLKRYAPSNTQH